MNLAGINIQVNFLKQCLVIRLSCELPVFLLKHQGIFTLNLVSILIILAIIFNAIDKKQTENFDVTFLRRKAHFLIQMFLDRAPDHQALQVIRVDTANFIAGVQSGFATRHTDFHRLVILAAGNRSDTAILINRPARLLFQIIAILNGHHRSPHIFTLGNIDFDLCSNRATLIVG